MKRCLTLFLKGKVQGVFFRVRTKETADQLDLTGYVENLADGRVKVVAEGEDKKLKQFLDWAQESPDHAKVNDIEKNFSQASGNFADFEIRY